MKLLKKTDFSADDYVKKTKFSADTNALDDKIEKVDKKIPDVSNLAAKSSVTILVKDLDNRIDKIKIKDYAKKTSLSGFMLTSTFNTKSTELENKIKSTDIIAKSAVTKTNTIKSDIKSDIKSTINKISKWKSTGIFNHFSNSKYFPSSGMNAVGDARRDLPDLKNNGRMYVYLNANHFQQNKEIIPNNNNVINIYYIYQIEPISSSRDGTFTVQNALFGAMQITKNADTSKYKYKGYGICFYEGGSFSKGNISNSKNVLIFGVDESSLVHANNKANNIYVMGDLFVQGINDTTLYAEKINSQNFTQPSKKFILSLHYNGNDSYLFVNGKQELKFKAKTSHLVKEKLCIGNISDKWSKSESEKTGLYGNIYDFVVDYEAIIGVKAMYDMRRYLMTKHNISL